MTTPRFVWIIRCWCSEDSFWEHVREHKDYDIAYPKPELLLEEINRIILKEQADWEDLCESGHTKISDRQFVIDKPSLEQLKNRPFVKFLTISNSNTASEDFMQSWYVERLKVIDA